MNEEACILILEADVLVRQPLAAYLRECGYRVLEAASADEARDFSRAAAAASICSSPTRPASAPPASRSPPGRAPSIPRSTSCWRLGRKGGRDRRRSLRGRPGQGGRPQPPAGARPDPPADGSPRPQRPLEIAWEVFAPPRAGHEGLLLDRRIKSGDDDGEWGGGVSESQRRRLSGPTLRLAFRCCSAPPVTLSSCPGSTRASSGRRPRRGAVAGSPDQVRR